MSEANAPPILSFQPDDGAITVDLDVLVTSRMLIQANSGGGKSWALRYLLEQTHGRIPQIVFDPEGEFASLRERFPYVLAGVDGDVPARPELAGALCHRLVELGASAVLDLYELEIEERQLFVKNFLGDLMRLPRALWRPLLVVIDEAHLFCPEKGAGSAVSKTAVAGLCTRGRKRGFCAILATQRIASLDKGVAAELNNVLIGRTGLDVDVLRAGNTLGFDKERRQTLPHLDSGVFYAFGPAISREVLQVRTGQVATSHPEPGRIAPPAPPPPDQLRELIARLADLPVQADPDVPDLETTQRRIAELERALRDRPAESRIERVEVPILTLEHVASLRVAAGGLETTAKTIAKYAADILAALDRVAPLPALEAPRQAAPPPKPDRARPAPAKPTRKPARPASRPASRSAPASGGARLLAPQQRILDALAAFEALGLSQVARQHIAVWSKQSPASSAFGNHLSLLRTAGLIDYPTGGFVSLTAAGRARARPTTPIRDLAQLHAAWYQRLPDAQARILRVLIEHYPRSIERTRLAGLAGQSPTSSAFGKHLSVLRDLGLVAYPQPAQVAATALLFPTLRKG